MLRLFTQSRQTIELKTENTTLSDKFQDEIVKKGAKSIRLTWLDTGTSIKSGGVKLVL
jgi:hypothetical protein